MARVGRGLLVEFWCALLNHDHHFPRLRCTRLSAGSKAQSTETVVSSDGIQIQLFCSLAILNFFDHSLNFSGILVSLAVPFLLIS